MMRTGEKLAKGAIAFALIGSVLAASAGTFIRGSGNGRVWQTDFTPQEPLVWRWGKATLATLTVVDHGRKRQSVVAVARNDGENEGSWTLPVPKDLAVGRERLYDITLALSNATAQVRVETARIARVANAAETGVEIRAKDADWGLVGTKGAALAYDSLWTNAPVSAVSLSAMRSGVATVTELDGKAGFQPLAVVDGSDTEVAATLAFDGLGYSSAYLWYCHFGPGLLLIFR